MSQYTAPRWRQRPPGSTWGDFRPDAQLGRLNLLTPEKVKQGLAEVEDGLSFCLSLPLNYPGEALLDPRRKERSPHERCVPWRRLAQAAAVPAWGGRVNVT